MKGEKVRGPRTTHFRSAKKKKVKKKTSQVEHVFIMQDAYTAARTGRYRSLLHPQEKILLPPRHKIETPTRLERKNITYQTHGRPDGIKMHTRHHLSLLFDSNFPSLEFRKIDPSQEKSFWVLIEERREGRKEGVIIISRITFDVAGMRGKKKRDAFYNTHCYTQRYFVLCVVVSGLFFFK